MQTFIFDQKKCDAEQITITGREAHHIAKVLRLRKNEIVRLIDGAGLAYICEIVKVSSKSVTCRKVKPIKNSGEASINLTLAIGLSTSSKFDIVIEKGTEVGVRKFIPLLAQKGKVKITDKSSASRKLKRWGRVAEAAAKQSGRSIIPEITVPVKYDEYIDSLSPENTILFHPDEKQSNLGDIFKHINSPDITLIIGPESGFSDDEVILARQKGIFCCSLGDRILRSETAGIVIPALFIYYIESVKD